MQVMKVLENFLWQQVHIDDMQFGFMLGRSTTDAIFIVHQLKGKFHAATVHGLFVDLEKAFDHIPKRVIWWALLKLSINSLRPSDAYMRR